MFSGLARRFTIIGWLRYYFLDRNYNQTVRFALIALCLGMTVLSTILFKNSVINNNYIGGILPVALVGMIMVMVFVYRYLEAMPLIIVGTSLLVADGIPTGTGTKLTFTFMLLWLFFFVWLFKALVVKRSFADIRPALANAPAIAFIVAVIISVIWSTFFVDPQVSYLFNEKLFPRLMTSAVLIISPLTYLLFATHLRSITSIRVFVWLFIGVGFIFGLIRVTSLSIPLINTKGHLPTWVVAFCAGQLFFNRDLKWYHRLFLAANCAIWLYIQLDLGLTWLSGWVPLCMAFGIIMMIYSRKLTVAVILILAVVLLLNVNFVKSTFNAENKESGNTRQDAGKIALELTTHHYLFGTGPAGYAYYYATYGIANYSHNNYIDIFAETGIVGFIIFVSIWVCSVVMVFRTYRIVPKNGFLHGVAISLIATSTVVFLIMALGDWVTPFTYTQTLAGIDYTIWSWMLAGLTVALYYTQKNSLKSETANDKQGRAALSGGS